jgi:hypothetical protein
VNSILFKFAVATHSIYGGDDEKAAKMAGNDLQGLISYFNCNIAGLYLPMTAIVDYMGFRGNTNIPITRNTLF